MLSRKRVGTVQPHLRTAEMNIRDVPETKLATRADKHLSHTCQLEKQSPNTLSEPGHKYHHFHQSRVSAVLQRALQMGWSMAQWQGHTPEYFAGLS